MIKWTYSQQKIKKLSNKGRVEKFRKREESNSPWERNVDRMIEMHGDQVSHSPFTSYFFKDRNYF